MSELRRRYEKRPVYQRPRIYDIAVGPDCETLRAEIEDWVAGLASAVRPEVISKLRSAKGFVQTYHELAVGNILRRLGHEVEYEKNVGGLTPDWCANATNGRLVFVVEVFTVRPPESAQKRDARRRHLLGRIEQIPLGVVLHIKVDSGASMDSQGTSKAIAKQVRDWLLGGNSSVGDTLDVKGVTFKLLARNPKLSSVGCICPGGAFFVNSYPLRRALLEKTGKYKSVALNLGIPLVVAAVADLSTGLDSGDFEDVLLGGDAVQVVFDTASDELVQQRRVRKPNGLFQRCPGLSAGLWVWRSIGEWQVKALHNSGAASPLPRDVFEMPVQE